MKVMIAYPALAGRLKPMLTQNRQFQWYHVCSYIYPLVPATAATLLAEQGFEVVWHDGIAEDSSPGDLDSLILEHRPELVAIETKTPVINRHLSIIENIKKLSPTTRVALMGDHVTALPEQVMKSEAVDFAITGGDYDVSLLGIARHILEGFDLPKGVFYRKNGRIVNTGPFVPTHDLDSLPFPDRKLTKAHLYGEKWRKREPFFYTLAGRDCPWHKCTFCAWTVLHPKFRVRTPENLAQEIWKLVNEHGAREVFDDTGTFPRGKWLEKFSYEVISSGLNRRVELGCNFRFDWLTPDTARLLKRTGFRKIKVGLESAWPETLEKIRKGTTVEQIRDGCRNAARAGLDVHLTVMYGFPWEGRKQAERTYELVKELVTHGWVEMLQTTVLVPYPGTVLYSQALENGWFLVRPDDWDAFDMSGPVLRPGPGMAPADVNMFAAKTYRLHFHPMYLVSRLFKVRGLDDLKYAVRGVRAILGHLKDFLSQRGRE